MASSRRIKPVRAAFRFSLGTALLVGLPLVLAVVVLSVLLSQSTHPAASSAPTHVSVDPQKAVVADVRKTTAAVKAYLRAYPTASAANLQAAKRTVSDGARETIAVDGNYRQWFVTGSDVRVSKTKTYVYQSFTNTFRWYDRTTGASTQIAEDTTPRNTNASH